MTRLGCAVASVVALFGCWESTAISSDAGSDRPSACTDAPFFRENFEGYPAGAPLQADWHVELAGNSLARVAPPEDGHGANESSRYLIVINNGSAGQLELSAATPPHDLSGCEGARLTFSLIVFSLETDEGDEAYVDVRGNGTDWITQSKLFPGAFPSILACRPGDQDTTGCVAWKSFSIDVPAAMLGPGVQARFRLKTTTDMNDSIGVDDIDLRGLR